MESNEYFNAQEPVLRYISLLFLCFFLQFVENVIALLAVNQNNGAPAHEHTNTHWLIHTCVHRHIHNIACTHTYTYVYLLTRILKHFDKFVQREKERERFDLILIWFLYWQDDGFRPWPSLPTGPPYTNIHIRQRERRGRGGGGGGVMVKKKTRSFDCQLERTGCHYCYTAKCNILLGCRRTCRMLILVQQDWLGVRYHYWRKLFRMRV